MPAPAIQPIRSVLPALALAVCGVASTFAAPPAAAQASPGRQPIKRVVVFPPGASGTEYSRYDIHPRIRRLDPCRVV